MVRVRYADGTQQVRTGYAAGTQLVRSRYAAGTQPVRSRYAVCVPDTRASITEYQFGTHVVRMEQLADETLSQLSILAHRDCRAKPTREYTGTHHSGSRRHRPAIGISPHVGVTAIPSVPGQPDCPLDPAFSETTVEA